MIIRDSTPTRGDEQTSGRRCQDGWLREADLLSLIDNAPKCVAGRSKLHGFGLIARVPIAAGEVVVDFGDARLFSEVPASALEPFLRPPSSRFRSRSPPRA